MEVVGTVAILGYLSPPLAAALVTVVPASSFLVQWLSKRVVASSQHASAAVAASAATADEVPPPPRVGGDVRMCMLYAREGEWKLCRRLQQALPRMRFSAKDPLNSAFLDGRCYAVCSSLTHTRDTHPESPNLSRAVGKLFVVPAWALPVSERPVRTKSPYFLRRVPAQLRQYRSKPAAQLPPISPLA
jgi:hypothetical protein